MQHAPTGPAMGRQREAPPSQARRVVAPLERVGLAGQPGPVATVEKAREAAAVASSRDAACRNPDRPALARSSFSISGTRRRSHRPTAVRTVS